MAEKGTRQPDGGLFLTSEEVAELTGYRRRKEQAYWLTSIGYGR